MKKDVENNKNNQEIANLSDGYDSADGVILSNMPQEMNGYQIQVAFFT